MTCGCDVNYRLLFLNPFTLYSKLIFNQKKNKKMDLREIINHENTTIVDVREPYEFATGSAQGAINIPLGTIPARLSEFKNMATPIVVYCRSGMRSAQAMGFLRAQGIKEVFNGGGLSDVVFYQNKAA